MNAVLDRPFETRASGKWVLAGEHAVLRGHMAVALPYSPHGLALGFEPALAPSGAPGRGPLRVEPSEASHVIRELLASIPALQGRVPAGRLRISSTIPVGAGLGSSAALCVALTRWLASSLALSASGLQEFATSLEDRFHGKSSGMDVAAILAGGPIRFTRGEPAEPIQISALPHFTFHDTGMRGATRDCIGRVEAIALHDPLRAREIDQRMGHASYLAAEGLLAFARSGDLALIVQSMDLSHECFGDWELVPPVAGELRAELLQKGALAARLTGAGGGGFIVALWKKPA